jgi:hypothetical protein
MFKYCSSALHFNNTESGNQKYKVRSININLAVSLCYLLLKEVEGSPFTSGLPTKLCMHFISPPFIEYCPSVLPSLTSTKLYPVMSTDHEAALYAIFSSLPPIPHSRSPIYSPSHYSHTLHSMSHYTHTHTHTHTYTITVTHITPSYIVMFIFFTG